MSFYGYKIYFWSKENDEPIHVHVSKGTPTDNSTKIWITQDGGCIIANNKSKIPNKDLRKITETLTLNHLFIMNEWKEYFECDKVKFYC